MIPAPAPPTPGAERPDPALEEREWRSLEAPERQPPRLGLYALAFLTMAGPIWAAAWAGAGAASLFILMGEAAVWMRARRSRIQSPSPLPFHRKGRGEGLGSGEG